LFSPVSSARGQKTKKHKKTPKIPVLSKKEPGATPSFNNKKGQKTEEKKGRVPDSPPKERACFPPPKKETRKKRKAGVLGSRQGRGPTPGRGNVLPYPQWSVRTACRHKKEKKRERFFSTLPNGRRRVALQKKKKKKKGKSTPPTLNAAYQRALLSRGEGKKEGPFSPRGGGSASFGHRKRRKKGGKAAPPEISAYRSVFSKGGRKKKGGEGGGGKGNLDVPAIFQRDPTDGGGRRPVVIKTVLLWSGVLPCSPTGGRGKGGGGGPSKLHSV